MLQILIWSNINVLVFINIKKLWNQNFNLFTSIQTTHYSARLSNQEYVDLVIFWVVHLFLVVLLYLFLEVPQFLGISMPFIEWYHLVSLIRYSVALIRQPVLIRWIERLPLTLINIFFCIVSLPLLKKIWFALLSIRCLWR